MIKFMGIDPDLPDFLGKWAIPAIALLGIIAFCSMIMPCQS